MSEKQQGKRPQAQVQPQAEERQLPKNIQDKASQVKKSQMKKKGSTCCYSCCEKWHFASSCPNGTLLNPIIIDDYYSLRKDKDGNLFAKFVGTQSGSRKEAFGYTSLL
jgi:hypothetical protein